jgi:hypothetical protein
MVQSTGAQGSHRRNRAGQLTTGTARVRRGLRRPIRSHRAVDRYLIRKVLTQRSRVRAPRDNLTAVRCLAVPTWKVIEQAEPEFAARVKQLFDAGRHKTIATLRADGSPRISGIECEFESGDLRFGSMTGARKGADLKRGPRFALHGPTFHPEEGKETEWPGEAKIAGRAIPAGPLTTDAANEEPVGEISSPTSPRSPSPDSTPRPPNSWSSHGPLGEGSEGSCGTDDRLAPVTEPGSDGPNYSAGRVLGSA